MSNIDFSDASISYLDIRKKQETLPQTNELGKTAFLELMIAQLNNQDPLKPQDNGEFIAQLAQFSSVEGIDRLNNSFDSFASNFTSNRALQASSLVGRSVSVPGNETWLLDGHLVSAQATIPATTSDLAVNIYRDSGELVQQYDLGFHPQGDVAFRWDGYHLEMDGEILDQRGGAKEPLPPGKYRIEVMSTQNGRAEQMEMAVSANVNSVSVEPNGSIILNLAGFGAVNLNDVRQFN